jgi:hypothetical protein
MVVGPLGAVRVGKAAMVQGAISRGPRRARKSPEEGLEIETTGNEETGTGWSDSSILSLV